MNRMQAIALFAVASLATAGRSIAQVHAVQATIPFNFSVGERLLPAGTYTIKEASDHVLVFRNKDNFAVTTIVALPEIAEQAGKRGKILFQKYGDQYFLHKILSTDASMNMRLVTSKREKQVLRQEAKLDTSSPVLVATR